MRDKLRVFRSFVFLIAFLPALVWSTECTTFTDIEANRYKSDILYASDQGWISCKVGAFEPTRATNRIEALKMVLEAGNHNPPETSERCFSDIEPSDWMNKYVCYAKKQNIIVDRVDFNAGGEVNFAEASKMIFKSMTNGYYNESINPWYQSYLDKMADYGFSHDAASTINRGYFTHILRTVESEIKKESLITVVSSIAPSSVKLNNRTVFAISGNNLPSDLALDIQDCTTMTQFGGNASALEFACTPTTSGVKIVEVRDQQGGTLLKTLSITVEGDSVVEPTPTPKVTSITPTEAQINTKTTFTVIGTDLPDTLAMYIPDCSGMLALGGTDTNRQFSCTPINGAGLKSAEIKDKPQGTILKAFGVNVIGLPEHTLSVNVIDIGGGTGQVSSKPSGIINCRDKNQGTCEEKFVTDVVLIAYPSPDSVVEFDTNQCNKIDGNECSVAMNSDITLQVSFKPKDNKMVLTLDAMPQSLKIHPNETIRLDFKVTNNRDNTVHVLQMNLDDGKGAINCKNNFSVQDIVTCEASYVSAGNYTLTATAYADEAMSIRSNMLSIPIEVSNTSDDTKYTGHQNQEHLRGFWTNNPTTAKEAFVVDTATGTQNLNLSFLAQSGQIDLAFGITYNSGLAKGSFKGVLGKGWSHSYGVLAHIEELDSNTLILHTSSSRKSTFKKDSDGIYLSINRTKGLLPNHYDKIIKGSYGYTLENSDKTQRLFDDKGRLQQIINKKGEKLFLMYKDNRLYRILEPIAKIALNYSYNDDGTIDKVSDDTGRVVSFHYTADQLTSITDVDGTAHIFSNNDNGEILNYKIENNTVSFNYFTNIFDDLGRVLSQKDANGYITTFDYDESSYALIKTTVTTPLNETRYYLYNSNYQLLEFSDELGYTTINKYTLSGQLRSTTNPMGLTTRYSYTDQGFTSKVESPNNATLWHYYDEDANLIETTDELGYTTKYTYKDNYLVKVEQNVNGTVKALLATKYTFGSFPYPDDTTTAIVSQIETTTAKGNKSTQNFQFGHLISSTTAEGVKTSYKYNNRGQLTQQILHAESGDYTTTFEYNKLGQIIKATDPEGKSVSKTYSIFGSVASLTDAKGNTLTNEYDDNGNLIQSTAPSNVVTKYTYDAYNQPTSITDANGHTNYITYDLKGRKKYLFNAQKEKLITYTYDKLDTVIQTYLYDDSDTKILASSNEYDIPTRYTKTTSFLGNLDRSVEQHLDPKGRVLQTRNSAGELKEFEYENFFDSVIEVKAYNETTKQSVDDEGNLKTLTDVIANTSKFDHDSQKDKTLEESALGKTHRTTYNSQYLVETFTNARGQKRDFTYYKNGWLKTATSNEVLWSFGYDDNGNLLTMSSSEGTITRSYDAFNRVTSYTDQNGNTLGYAYDKVGNLTKLTYPNGKSVTYTYDSSNRLQTVTDWNGIKLVEYRYSRQGKLLQELRANGTKRTYTYFKGIGELESIKDTKADGSTIVAYIYEYDLKGNIVKETKTDDTKTTVFGYTYSPKGILEKATIEPREEIYNVSHLAMTHIGDNRADTIDTQPVSYDEDGNMVAYMLGGKYTTLEYDEKSRLTKVGDIQHRYSIEDAKIATTVNSKTTNFVVDTNRKLSQLLIEQLPNGDEVYHIYGAGLVATLDKDGTHYYHHDYRGSTVALTDKDEKITDKYTYLPYGKMIHHSGMNKTRFLYVGKYGIEREASGLYYMRARYYDADIMRFISKDSLVGSVSDGLSLNRYLYVNGNPIIHTDSTGKAIDKEGPLIKALGYPVELLYSADTLQRRIFDIDSYGKKQIESWGWNSLSAYQEHYRHGGGESVHIDINKVYNEYSSINSLTTDSFSKENIKLLEDIKMGGYTDDRRPYISVTVDWFIFGHANIIYDSNDDTISIQDDTYNFDYKANQAIYSIRNIGNFIDKAWHGIGTPFDIVFEGKVKLPKPKLGIEGASFLIFSTMINGLDN